MNKNLKKIVAIALVVGTISAVAPVSNINFLTTKAYASDDENDDTTLDKLELETSKGDSIKFYKEDDYSDKVDKDEISAGDTYYAKTSSKKIKISTSGPKSKYIKAFKGTKDSTKGKSLSDDIELSSGTNTITVRVYSSKPDSSVRYDDSYENEYKLKVKYTGSDSDSSSDSDDNADDYDSIYLESLSVGGNKISLSDSKVKYSYDVTSDTKEVTIKAEPKDSDDEIYIDGRKVDKDDKYKRTVDIDKDKSEIDIKVENEDDEEKRVYTLTINRLKAAEVKTTASTTVANSQPATATNVPGTAATTTVKASQWVPVNGGWQYNDAAGITLKNQWFFDRNLGKWYYLGADGMMASNCWIQTNGKYYYLYPNGSMATDTTIGNYKVNKDGAWYK